MQLKGFDRAISIDRLLPFGAWVMPEAAVLLAKLQIS